MSSSKTVLAVGRLTYSRCMIVSSEPTTCPLCRAAVPANVQHECSQTSPQKKRMAKATRRPHVGESQR